MPPPNPPQRIAVVGAGMAGIACARTLMQAGCDVTVFEAKAAPGGRMATQQTPHGSFDSGAQYFTVRDERFARALEASAVGLVRRWSVSAVRVLDERGRIVEAAPPPHEAHWLPVPTMSALAAHWAAPIAARSRLRLGSPVLRVQRERGAHARWQLVLAPDAATASDDAGFDALMCALPAPAARALLADCVAAQPLLARLEPVVMAPCWTLLLAYPQAAQAGLQTLGPQWNAARSTHHRIVWLARESSKPQRTSIERWVVQAGSAWSTEHAHDDPERVTGKLLRAFGEITGIRVAPGHAQARLWPSARTLQPLGSPYLWDAASGLGLCGDWCIGQRVEDAFVSGLELALALSGR